MKYVEESNRLKDEINRHLILILETLIYLESERERGVTYVRVCVFSCQFYVTSSQQIYPEIAVTTVFSFDLRYLLLKGHPTEMSETLSVHPAKLHGQAEPTCGRYYREYDHRGIYAVP